MIFHQVKDGHLSETFYNFDDNNDKSNNNDDDDDKSVSLENTTMVIIQLLVNLIYILSILQLPRLLISI